MIPKLLNIIDVAESLILCIYVMLDYITCNFMILISERFFKIYFIHKQIATHILDPIPRMFWFRVLEVRNILF